MTSRPASSRARSRSRPCAPTISAAVYPLISSIPLFHSWTLPSDDIVTMPSEVCSTISASLRRSSRISSNSEPFASAPAASRASVSSTESSPSSKPSGPEQSYPHSTPTTLPSANSGAAMQSRLPSALSSATRFGAAVARVMRVVRARIASAQASDSASLCSVVITLPSALAVYTVLLSPSRTTSCAVPASKQLRTSATKFGIASRGLIGPTSTRVARCMPARRALSASTAA